MCAAFGGQITSFYCAPSAHMLLESNSILIVVSTFWLQNEMNKVLDVFIYCCSLELVVFTQYEQEVATRSTELCG